MLKRLRALLRQQPAMSLAELAARLEVAPEVARALCAFWMARGRVERLARGPACGGCTQCAPDSLEFYRWIEAG